MRYDPSWPFTRGWTLQELIAPKVVEFYFREGDILGTKEELRSQISGITGIPPQALGGTPLARFTVEERMAWATNRQTKRKEDKAYCLLGIFDVSMPLIYGERDKALARLREEIQKSSAIQNRVSHISTGDTQSYRPSQNQSTAEDRAITYRRAQTNLPTATGEMSHTSRIARSGLHSKMAAAGLSAGSILGIAGDFMRERQRHPGAPQNQPVSYEPRSDHHISASGNSRVEGYHRYYTDPRTGKSTEVDQGKDAEYSKEQGRESAMDDLRNYDLDEQAPQKKYYTRSARDFPNVDSFVNEIEPVQAKYYNDYFVPGTGIDREVIQHMICRYFGNDATVRPYQNKDGRTGFLVRFYTALTSAIIDDLKKDSAKWRKDRDQDQRQGRSTGSYAEYAAEGSIDRGACHGDRLLSAGSAWDYIQRSEQFRLSLIDVGDVSERLKHMTRDDGHGPVFRESDVRQAIQESASAGPRNDMI
ncbi:Vegetative incompatibility protein HET-E-1 [Cyphellophora attinorum]|uniref:Vegetative incompatibility protein HET-E-1 n=1 Tax=Cyphellophora attinorum TaxID=1664694 RepID=A0A0N1HDW1_9EURO|nr:Vegetative incompatibility protein HET-E-1 [Phialophora attinorum]KPI42775.1 Vegetative incompatibility protein HET-E-1 [Phialophora attinorum]